MQKEILYHDKNVRSREVLVLGKLHNYSNVKLARTALNKILKSVQNSMDREFRNESHFDSNNVVIVRHKSNNNAPKSFKKLNIMELDNLFKPFMIMIYLFDGKAWLKAWYNDYEVATTYEIRARRKDISNDSWSELKYGSFRNILNKTRSMYNDFKREM